ncbi:unnamed protein product, partial [Symbiodinium sp. KB8]
MFGVPAAWAHGDDPGEKDTPAWERPLLGWITFSSALASAVVLTVMMASYSMFPRMRRSPGPLLMARGVCELLFSLDVALVRVTGFAEGEGAADRCQPVSFFTHAVSLASDFYFLALCASLVRAIVDPFATPGASHHFLVIGTALAVATVPLLLRDTDDRLPYGRDELMDICWLHEYHDAVDESNFVWQTWVLYNGIVWSISVWALTALCFTRARLRRGIESTIRTRTRVIRDMLRVTAVYLLFWVLTTSVMVADMFNGRSIAMDVALAMLLGLRGSFTAVAWASTLGGMGRVVSWWAVTLGERQEGALERDAAIRAFRKALLEDKAPAQLLSSAIRREIVTFASIGIRKAALRAAQRPQTALLSAQDLDKAESRRRVRFRLTIPGLYVSDRASRRRAARRRAAAAAQHAGAIFSRSMAAGDHPRAPPQGRAATGRKLAVAWAHDHCLDGASPAGGRVNAG